MGKPAQRKIDGPSLSEVVVLIKNNPEATINDFVDKFNCDRQRVYHARSIVGVNKRRASTAPKKAGLKTVRSSTLDAKDKRIAELEKELADWLTEFEKEKEKLWESTERRFENFVDELQSDLMQAKAVIAYLEKKVANGASV